MKIRNNIIARLPLCIREQLNTRLLEKEPANLLVDWLNSEPEVHAVMDSVFQGRPISESDLSEWKKGGYLAWAAIDSCLDHSQLVTEGAEHVAGTGIGAEQLLHIITARLGELLQTMDVMPEAAFNQKLAALERLTKSAVTLRKCEQHDARMELDRERLQLQREKQRNKSASSVSSPASSSRKTPAASVSGESSAPEKPNNSGSSSNSDPTDADGPSVPDCQHCAQDSSQGVDSKCLACCQNTGETSQNSDSSLPETQLAPFDPSFVPPVPAIPSLYASFPPNSRDRRSRFGLL